MMYLPSAVTMMNLALGVISLIFTFNHRISWSAVAILVAVVMDCLDGMAARKLNSASDFGKELDSLADMVSFGVAPALLILQVLNAFQVLGIKDALAIAVCILYILCGAYRLARFNVLNISDYYVGVPITIAGGLVALLVLFRPDLAPWQYFITLLLLSWLMISRITVRKYLKKDSKDFTA